MLGLLALIGLGVVLWYLSKGLKKLGEGLAMMSTTAVDLVALHNKKALNNNKIIRQNKKAEEDLQTIMGEESHAAYNHKVQSEIEDLIKGLNPRS